MDTNSFIDSAVAALQQRLDRAVENGRLSQAEADQRVETFRNHLTERLNQSGVPEATVTPV